MTLYCSNGCLKRVVTRRLTAFSTSLGQLGQARGHISLNRLCHTPHIAFRPQTSLNAQEYHPGVVATLAEASASTRRAFLDLAFLRKQRQRSGGASSRSWYVTVDHWITGTLAATEAEQAFGGEEVRPHPSRGGLCAS